MVWYRDSNLKPWTSIAIFVRGERLQLLYVIAVLSLSLMGETGMASLFSSMGGRPEKATCV